MEDVKFSISTKDPSTLQPEVGDQVISAEEPKLELNERNTTVEDCAPLLAPPKQIVEVVIEKKTVLEPEDSIIPDHYYDNGNIPVFRPVCH